MRLQLSTREQSIVDLERKTFKHDNDAKFANSLLSIFNRSGHLTGKQWHYVRVLNKKESS